MERVAINHNRDISHVHANAHYRKNGNTFIGSHIEKMPREPTIYS